jgi:hypothetical protein
MQPRLGVVPWTERYFLVLESRELFFGHPKFRMAFRKDKPEKLVDTSSLDDEVVGGVHWTYPVNGRSIWRLTEALNAFVAGFSGRRFWQREQRLLL